MSRRGPHLPKGDMEGIGNSIGGIISGIIPIVSTVGEAIANS